MTDATQPAEDLERVLAEIDYADRGDSRSGELSEGERLILGNWPAIYDGVRAVLTERRELRKALRELAEDAEDMEAQIQGEWGISTDPGYGEDGEALKRAKALLAQPAAGEEG